METELNYQRLDKDARKCMRISAVIVWGIMLIPAFVFLLFMELFSEKAALWIYIGAVFFAIVYVILVPAIRYARYRYAVDEEAIRVREGFLWITESIVPMERLHKLSLSQGPVDRLFKLSKVQVTTAGGDVTIKFLKEDTASEIARGLERKINLIAAEEKKQSAMENR